MSADPKVAPITLKILPEKKKLHGRAKSFLKTKL
jgi:hypothetical protein